MGGGRGDFRAADAVRPCPHGVVDEESAWRASARNGLLLIIVWCLGSMAMRITDLAVAVSLDYPYSRYDSMVLAAFDAATAALAIWLRINLRNDSASARLITTLCGLVATLSISRVIVGVVLAPRFAEPPNAATQNPVYGNDLAQQITSTFDVVLAALALCILVAAIITGHLTADGALRAPRRPQACCPGSPARVARGDDPHPDRAPANHPPPARYRN